MKEQDVELGRIALANGWVTKGQLNECLAASVVTTNTDLATILRDRGLIDDRQAADLREDAAKELRDREGRVEAPSSVLSPQDTIPQSVIEAAQDPRNHIGKFIRVKELGQAWYGSVWKAWDADLMAWRALKFLEASDREANRTVFEQAQIAGRVKHPNLVRVYECDEWKDAGRAIPFLVLDYVEGRTLEEVRAEGVSAEKAASLIRDAADAVAAAHEHGVLHLDLTPRHVVVDSRDQVHITDFGLSAPVGTIGPEDSVAPTSVVEIVGTPEYMSPEQAVGRKIDITVRSDVYMLGATLYYLLTGKPPFSGERPLDVCFRVVREPVPKPSLHARNLSPDLERIVLRAMDKDPAKRYESAKVFGNELDRFLHSAPILSDDQLRFTQGISALHAGHMEETIHMFRDLLRIDPRSDNTVAGRDAILRTLKEGEEGLTLAIQQQQKNYDVRTQRGITRLAQAIMMTLDGRDPAGACKGAMDDFVKSCELRAQSAIARMNRANVLTFSARYARDTGKDVSSLLRMALDDLTAAIGFDGTASAAYHNRGIIRFYLAQSAKKTGGDPAEEYRKAVEDFSVSSRLEPTYAYIWKDLGVAKVSLAKELLARKEKVKHLFEEAIKDLGQAVQMKATLAAAWFERGHAHFAVKLFPNAVQDWERTLELDPSRRTKVEPLIKEAKALHEKRSAENKP